MKALRQLITLLIVAMTASAALAAPVITNVMIVASDSSTATIQWTTDTASSSQLLYGTSPNLIYSNNVDPTLVTSHSMTLTLLSPGNMYYVAAVSKDNTGPAQSQAITFSLCGDPNISVSGTINNYYEYGTFQFTWIPPTGAVQTPTVCGQPLTQTVAGNLSGSGGFNATIADASKVVPGPGQWQVQAADVGNLAPITTTQYLTFQSQDVSSALQSQAAVTGLSPCWTNTITNAAFPATCGTGGGGGGGSLGTLPNDLVGADTNGNAQDLYNFYATGNFSVASALAAAQAHNGTVTITPSVGRQAFLNTGNTHVDDQRTDIPANARGATEFGAQCDLQSNGTTFNAGSTSLTGYGFLFDQTYQGRVIVTVGSVNGLPTVFETAIQTVNSSANVTVTTPFPFSQTIQHATDIGHDDTAAITQGMSVVGAGGTLLFPQGNCLTHAQTIQGQNPVGVGPNSVVTSFPGENIWQGIPGQQQGKVHYHDISYNLDQRINATQPWQLCIEGTCTQNPGVYQPVGIKTGNSSNPLAPGWCQGAGANFSGCINGVASTTAANAVMCVPPSETAPAVGSQVVFPYFPSVYTGTVSSTAGTCSGGFTARTLSAPLPATATQAEWFAGTSFQNLATAITSSSCPATITLANSINPVAGFESNVAPKGLIQIDGEQLSYNGKSNAGNPTPANTLYGIQCGVNGTTRANHSTTATVVPLNPFKPAYPWPVIPTLNQGDTTPSANAGFYPYDDVGNAVFSFGIPSGSNVASTGSWGPGSEIDNVSAFYWPQDYNGQQWGGVNHGTFMYLVAPPYGVKFHNLSSLYLYDGIAAGAPSIENANWSGGQPTADGTTWDQIAIWAANPVQLVTGGQNNYSNFNVYSSESTSTGVTLGADQCFFFTPTFNDQNGSYLGIIGQTEFHNLYCEPEAGTQAGKLVSWEWDVSNSQIYDQHMGGGGEVYLGGIGNNHWFGGNFGNSSGAPLINWVPGNTTDYVLDLGSDPKGSVYGTNSLIDFSYFTKFSGSTNQQFGTATGPYGTLGGGNSREPIPAQTNTTFDFGNLTAPFTSSEGGYITPEEFNSNFAFENQAMNVPRTYDATQPQTKSYVGCAVGNNVNNTYCFTTRFNLQSISIGDKQRLVKGKYELYASLKDLTATTNTAHFTIFSNCSGASYSFTPAITNTWPTTRKQMDMGTVNFSPLVGQTGCYLAMAFNGLPTADTLQIGFMDFAPVAESFNADTINVTTLNTTGGGSGGTASGCQQSPVTGISNGYTCPTLGNQTILTAAQGASDTTATVASTAGFSAAGCVFIDSEYECYTAMTGTTFTGIVRGQYRTAAAAHASGANLVSIILVFGNPQQTPPGEIVYGSSVAPVFAWNCINPGTHGGASVFAINCGPNESWFDATGGFHQQNGATIFANSFASAVLIGTNSNAPLINSSGNLLQSTIPGTALQPQSLAGGHAGSLNVIQPMRIGPPVVQNALPSGSSSVSWLCSGFDIDGNSVPGNTVTVTGVAATWAFPGFATVSCPWSSGVVTYQIWRMAGGGTQGLIGTGTNTGNGYGVYDFGAAVTGTPPATNTTNPHISVTGTGTPCITMSNGTSTPSICWVTGAPTGSCSTGSLDLRLDGGASSTEYVCEAGSWVGK